MTEDEAKTKWCPMARWSGGTELGADWNTRQQAENRCLASGCMAWRWTGVEQSATAAYRLPDGGTCYPAKVSDLHDCEKAGYPRLGYCGLAGEP